MPTPPSPITIPTSLTYRSVTGRVIPLTNLELDGNFAYLENLAEQRLPRSEFEDASNIVDILNSDPATASAGGLNAGELRGYGLASANVAESLVLRDSTGAFYASVVHATTFNGKATDADTADKADKLATARTINGVSFDGTANITIADSTRVAKSGDTMTGKLLLVEATTSAASLTLPHGTAPTSPANGDVWTTTLGQFNRIGGTTRRVAYIDSDISGTASNVTGTIALTNGGTGATTAAAARTNLGAAASGINSDITRLSGLTTAITAAQGGTGLTSPGAAGNVLTSNGNGTWSAVEPMYVPSGAVMAFAMSTAPSGWLECNGETISRSTYATLFAAIGTTYGAGNGTTTFKLPDLRGMFIRGWDHNRAVDGSRAFGSYQDDEFKSHIHQLKGNDRGNNYPQKTAPGLWNDDAEFAVTDTKTISATGGSETRPKNIAMMFCIKI